MEWYKLIPQDAFFVRAAEPMEIGESHSSSFLFPPPASTFCGAFRTLTLTQNDISIEEYYKNSNSNNNDKADTKVLNIIKSIGKANEKSAFSICGPLFYDEEDIYIVCPYTWFAESKKIKKVKNKDNIQDDEDIKIKIIKGKSIPANFIKNKINAKVKNLIFATNTDTEVSSLGGFYIKLKDFINIDLLDDSGEARIYQSSYFFRVEPRTGIALDTKIRKNREGHIYSFSYIRLINNFTMILGVSSQIPILDKGTLQLGAEGKLIYYEKLINSEIVNLINKLLIKETSDYYLSLSSIESDLVAPEDIVACGNIKYIGGWDMQKRFHKSMIGQYSAGSVFTRKIKEDMIPIKIDTLEKFIGE